MTKAPAKPAAQPIAVNRRAWKEAEKRRIAEHSPNQDIRDQVMTLAYLKTKPDIIARILNINLGVLKHYYAVEVRDGPEIIAAMLGMKIVEAAVRGDKGALGQIARAQGVGRRDEPPKESEDSGGKSDGIPLGDLTTATDQQLAAILSALKT